MLFPLPVELGRDMSAVDTTVHDNMLLGVDPGDDDNNRDEHDDEEHDHHSDGDMGEDVVVQLQLEVVHHCETHRSSHHSFVHPYWIRIDDDDDVDDSQ